MPEQSSRLHTTLRLVFGNKVACQHFIRFLKTRGAEATQYFAFVLSVNQLNSKQSPPEDSGTPLAPFRTPFARPQRSNTRLRDPPGATTRKQSLPRPWSMPSAGSARTAGGAATSFYRCFPRMLVTLSQSHSSISTPTARRLLLPVRTFAHALMPHTHTHARMHA